MRRVPWMTGALLPFLVGALLAQESAPPFAGDPPGRAARISYVFGNVSLQPSGDSGWSLASLNYPVTTGDRLYADHGARAELQVGSLAVRISDAADLTVTNLTDQLAQLGLAQGSARVSVYRMDPGDSVEVDTPHGALILLAPGAYRVDALEPDAMVVTVEQGSLQWTAGGVAQVVQEGQAIRVSGINPIQVASVAFRRGDAFDKWSDERDRRVSASRSSRYVSRDIPGYEDLDDYGSWRVETSYGPVWYPTAVPIGWVPYRFGHWVWIEPWGWTWVEHARWGYAPFHYGRWVYVGARWGWIPGPVMVRPYYAPALVVFVGGGSFSAGVQAWFPLGPDEPYYPWYHHDDVYLRQVNITNIRNVTNFGYLRDATYINRIQYRNRPVATTAVPNEIFQSGQPIGRRAIPVDRDMVRRAEIIPHPVALPAPSAAAGGTPSLGVPKMRRPNWVEAPAPRPSPPVSANQPLVVPRSVPAPGPTPALITRRAPPPQDLPFAERRKAMQPDAGRPLEPQQIQNLRSGRPAGPRRDPEYPPHAAPAPAAREAPKARPAPAPAPESKRERRPAERPRP